MPLRGVVLGVTLAALTAATAEAATGAAAAPAPQLAQWRTYDLLIDLRQLPHSYTCTELWYKFRDLLLQIGARHYMLIEPYACAAPGGGAARSPHVHVKFQLPFVLAAADARYAELSSVQRMVRLTPGRPASLQGSDCALLEQLRSALLGALPVHVTAASFHCSDGSGAFSLTLDAAVPAAGTATPPVAAH
jgi:hypothetical protein